MIETDMRKIPLCQRIVIIEAMTLSISVEELRAHIARREASLAADSGPFEGETAKRRELFLIGVETEKLLCFYLSEMQQREARIRSLKQP